MAGTSESKKIRLAAWLEERRPERIDDSSWYELKSLLAPVSEPYLRRLIRGSGIPMSPLVEGVNQEDLSNLERTLLALEHEYSGGNSDRAKLCRARVITAKDHLKWRMRRLPADSPERRCKEEAMLWLMTWLENPGLFHSWLSLRKKAAGGK